MNRKHPLGRLAYLVGLSVVVFSTPLHAQVDAFRGAPTGGDTRNDSLLAGWGFYANTSGTTQVNQLGFWVSPADSGGTGMLAIAHQVGLYDFNSATNSDTLIAEVTIPAGATGDANQYAWASIPALTLSDTR